MSDDLRIALTASLNDKLVGPMRRALDEVEKNLRRIEGDLRQTTTTGTQAGNTLANMRGPQQATRQAAELARETRNAITLAERLRNAWSSTGNVVKGVAQGVAAFQAARMAVAPALQAQRTYGRQLADAANTAFADRDTSGRLQGMQSLDATVTAALRAGGGSRESALAALNEMLASGSVSPDQARNLLPLSARYATAGNTSITDISTIVVRALQSGFKEADIPRMLDMALAAGQAGGFELKDMARWLPRLLASGQMSGLTTIDDYGRILASAQGSVITAGTKEEAGNNLQNLLLKINSADTAQDAKKLGIDLSGSLAAARAKGVNSLDAFVNLVAQISAQDPRMAKLRAQAATAGTDEDRRASYEAQASILQGSAIGKLVQDRQALLPLVAELNRRDYIQDVRGQVGQARGQFGEANFALVSQTADFKLQQVENERLFAQTKGVEGANGAIGRLSELTTELYQKYPDLAKWTEMSALALKGLAAAAAGAGAAALLMGKGLFGGAAAKVAASAGGAAVAGGAARAASHLTGPLLADVAAGVGTGAALSGGAAIGLTAAGAAVVGAPILATGMYLDNRANSPKGLAGRISDRSARIGELDQLLAASREGGASPAYMEKLQAERDALANDRAALSQKLGAAAGGGRGFLNPSLTEAADAAQQREGRAKAAEDIARVMAKLDQTTAELKAVAARPVVVQVDGREIAATTNAQNAFEGRRQ